MSRTRQSRARERGKSASARAAKPGGGTETGGLIYGLHTVTAALANPRRALGRLHATDNAATRLADLLAARGIAPVRATPAELDRLLGAGAVHQGVALEVAALAQPDLDDLADTQLLVILDQITDPQNVGAILRSAAAFGADALVLTARRSPALSATVAKAASGALEHVPVVAVPNLAQALARLGEFGFRRVGLDGDAPEPFEDRVPEPPLAIVLGAEGKGLRRLTRERCDMLCRLATRGPASLNVSNAAAVALHGIALSPTWRQRP